MPNEKPRVCRRSAIARRIRRLAIVGLGIGWLLGAFSPTVAAPPAAGLRPLWDQSRVVGTPEPPLPYLVKPAFPNLKVSHPIYLEHEPGSKQNLGQEHFLLVHQDQAWTGAGRILRFRNDPEVTQYDVLIETKRLIYGLTFHPDYERNGYLFVCSNGPIDAANKMNRISRFTVSREPPFECDADSELVILEWESNGHNGGDLEFGPDGMLYVPTGDGTSDSDTNDTGQDLSNLLSVMIRIDVDHPDRDRPYSIPKDNPFLHLENARPEAWAFGFRNPWRMTFDDRTGHLWVGNNGQDLWEQIFFVRRGENYGWSVYEGSHPFQLGRKRGPAPIALPALEHPHSEARSLTGGVVYYGSRFPELEGVYLYGDYSTGRIWGARHDGREVTWHRELADTTLQITGFATGPKGHLYICDHGGGIQRLVKRPVENNPVAFPRRLSETGLFEATAENLTHPGLVSYTVNTPQWADGAGQDRWLGLPGDAKIRVPNVNTFELPEQTVLMKTLWFEMEPGDASSRRRIETQLLTKQQGEWAGYSYRWNEDQTDATLVDAAGEEVVLRVPDPRFPGGLREQQWRFASRTECMMCHSRAARFVLGFTPEQLNVRPDTIGQRRASQPASTTASPSATSAGSASGLAEEQLHRFESLRIFEVPWSQVRRQWLTRLRQGPGRLTAALMIARRAWQRVADLGGAGRGLVQATDRLPVIARSASLWQLAARRGDEHRKRLLAAWDQLYPHSWLLAPRPYEFPRLYRLASSASLEARARSYLHANCAVCHTQAGGGNALMELSYKTALDKTRLINVPPQHERFQLRDPRLIAAGDPYRSLLLYRMCKAGGGRMPRVGSQAVDVQAFRVLRDWVASLEGQRTTEPDDERTDESIHNLRVQQRLWLGQLTQVDSSLEPQQQADTIQRLLQTTSGAFLTWDALQLGQLPDPIARAVIEAARQAEHQPVRDLFEYYLPFEQRAKRLGTDVDPQQILSLEGDPRRGRELFLTGSGLQCRTCHRVGEDSPETPEDPIGPDLARLKPRRSRAELLESILEPSKRIEPRYAAVLVETLDGKVHSGIEQERSATHLVLKDARNQVIRLDTQQVDVVIPQQKSLMPEFLIRDLTAEQLADLLAFLVSLQEAGP